MKINLTVPTEEVTPITPLQLVHQERNMPTVHPPKYNLLTPDKKPSMNLSLPIKNTMESTAKKLDSVSQCKELPGLMIIVGSMNTPMTRHNKLMAAIIYPILLALRDFNYSVAFPMRGLPRGCLESS